MAHSSIYRLNSIVVIAVSTKEKVPFAFASVVAAMSAVIAARYSEVARLIRRTPTSASAAAVNDLPLIPPSGVPTLIEYCQLVIVLDWCFLMWTIIEELIHGRFLEKGEA